VPAVLARVQCGAECRGGVIGYPLQTLYEEVAFVAYHFHWPQEEIVNLEHADRLKWVREISAINERKNSERTDEPSFEAKYS
jgi:hypothetical protein